MESHRQTPQPPTPTPHEYLAKDGVLLVQPLAAVEGDEELAAVAVGEVGVGHGHLTSAPPVQTSGACALTTNKTRTPPTAHPRRADTYTHTWPLSIVGGTEHMAQKFDSPA